MSGNNILSLLGLALRGGRLTVGEEPTALAAGAGKARLILLAADAGERTLRRGAHLAEEGHCLCLSLPFSKAELGGALGRASAAITALTDIGLAAALTRRLAALDPERYEEIARRMELKRRRALERKDAPRRDRRQEPDQSGQRRKPGDRRREPQAGGRAPGAGGRKGSNGRVPGAAEKNRPRSGKPGGPPGRNPGRPYQGRPAGGRPPQNRGGPKGRGGGKAPAGGGR